MKTAHRLAGWILAIFSAWCLVSGLGVALGTSGQVSGSEFGMLITIAHLLSLMLSWLTLWGVWHLTKPPAGQ